MRRPIYSRNGGLHQLLHTDQSDWEKASMPPVSGHQNQLLKRGHTMCVCVANLSTEWGPHRASSTAKSRGCNFQSSISMILDK